MFLPYASSAFVPVDTMPSWLQGFAAHQPITPVVETLRGLLLGGRRPRLVPRSPGAPAILVVSVAASGWLFRRRTG